MLVFAGFDAERERGSLFFDASIHSAVFSWRIIVIGFNKNRMSTVYCFTVLKEQKKSRSRR